MNPEDVRDEVAVSDDAKKILFERIGKRVIEKLKNKWHKNRLIASENFHNFLPSDTFQSNSSVYIDNILTFIASFMTLYCISVPSISPFLFFALCDLR